MPILEEADRFYVVKKILGSKTDLLSDGGVIVEEQHRRMTFESRPRCFMGVNL